MVTQNKKLIDYMNNNFNVGKFWAITFMNILLVCGNDANIRRLAYFIKDKNEVTKEYLKSCMPDVCIEEMKVFNAFSSETINTIFKDLSKILNECYGEIDF